MATTPAQPQRDTAVPGASPLAGRKIAVALSGGIACCKTATLVSRLVQRGASIRVLMTEAATRFVGPLTFQALSGQPVLTSIWDRPPGYDHPESQHVGVARWCDLMVVAPASADLIAKLAHGLTDDVVSLVACALPRDDRRTPLLVAPAMNADMWASPIVQRNIATLRDVLGVELIGPGTGWQACRTSGAGRMSEPEEILAVVEGALTPH